METHLINVNFNELYPLSEDSIDKIVKWFNGTRNKTIGIKSVKDLKVVGSFEDELIVVLDQSKPIKGNTIEKIIDAISDYSNLDATIIVSSASSGVFKIVKKTDKYTLISIDKIMTTEARETVPIFMGRYAHSQTPITKKTDPKKVLTIAIPSVGYPEIGKDFTGDLVARDIYKIIEIAKHGLGNTDPKMQFKVKGFEILFGVFKEANALISTKAKAGEEINAKEFGVIWNDILKRNGFVEHFSKKGGN